MLPTNDFEKQMKPLVTTEKPTVHALLSQGLMGTNSVYDWKHYKKWAPMIGYHVSCKIDTLPTLEQIQPLNRPDIRNIAQHLENIRHIFNIPISHIADLLHVSRQAVYKWLAGNTNPEQEKQNILTTLSQIADKFQEANVARADTLLKMKAFDGRSLLDIVLSGEDASQYIIILIKEAQIMQASYEKSGLSSSKAESTSDWQSYISIPGSSEKD